MADVITVHELFRRWILYIFWGIRFDMVKKNLVPPQNGHLTQAEKSIYTSQPFDLLEIVIGSLRQM